jgi:hypothetical protein
LSPPGCVAGRFQGAAGRTGGGGKPLGRVVPGVTLVLEHEQRIKPKKQVK